MSNNFNPIDGYSHGTNDPVAATVAIFCVRCGAGVAAGSHDDGYLCTACGTEFRLRACPDCNQVVHIPAMLYGKSVRCLSCGRTAGWNRWQKKVVSAGAVAARINLPQSEVADYARRIVVGCTIASSGIPSLMPAMECTIEFSARRITLLTRTSSGYRGVQAIDYSTVDFLEISGRGASARTTNAGIIGGGFGIKGALEGMAVAGVINYLTQRTATSIETIVHLKAGRHDVLLDTNTFTPAVLQVQLSPVFARIEHARRWGSPDRVVNVEDRQSSLATPPTFEVATERRGLGQAPEPLPTAGEAAPSDRPAFVEHQNVRTPPNANPIDAPNNTAHQIFTAPDQPARGNRPERDAHRNSKAWLIVLSVVVAVGAGIGGIAYAGDHHSSAPSDNPSPIADQASISGSELQNLLRTKLNAAPGTTTDPSSIRCPSNMLYQAGDVAQCSVSLTPGTVSVMFVTLSREGDSWHLEIDMK